MVLAATEAAFHPAVDDVEGEWGVHADGRVERRRRLPRAIAHTGDEFADGSGRLKRQWCAVASDRVSIRR
jgi:hypothetical protein